jgi:hypothetical protein
MCGVYSVFLLFCFQISFHTGTVKGIELDKSGTCIDGSNDFKNKNIWAIRSNYLFCLLDPPHASPALTGLCFFCLDFSSAVRLTGSLRIESLPAAFCATAANCRSLPLLICLVRSLVSL